MTAPERKMYLRKIWINRYNTGICTKQEAAEALNIHPESVNRLRKRLRDEGEKIFVHGNKNRTPHNKMDPKKEALIVSLYYRDWQGTPYETFRKALADFEHIHIKYTQMRNIMKRNHIKPMKAMKPKEKAVHESRRERATAGELLQMDASKHDWFMNGTYVNCHGGIDDATHQITGLYFCLNECRLGYNEVLRQTFLNYGVPKAVYIDRHSSFVKTPHSSKSKRAYTLEEKLQTEKNSSTHFKDLCDQLNIEVILALSAQGKGRIERLWQTLQGILPFYFRKLKITNCQEANRFIEKWVPQFNQRFCRKPRIQYPSWRESPTRYQLDFLLAVKENHRTDSYGEFVFHDHLFSIKAEKKASRKFTLCLSEQFGMKAFMNGKYYDVVLEEPLANVRGERMTLVEQDLISRYVTNDLREVYTG